MTQAILFIPKHPHMMDTIPANAKLLPLTNEINKQTLLKALDNACDFPSYFAHNWDSAWDCLTDSDVENLSLDLTAINTINTEDFNVFKNMIQDAFQDFGKPKLWVIVNEEPNR